MTVIETVPKVQYIGPYNAGDVLPLTFPYNDAADVKCSINNVDKVYNIDYSVTGANVTVLIPVAAEETISLFRVTPADQQADFPQNTKFDSAKMNEALDKICMQQQEQDETLSRCVKVQMVSDVDPDELITHVERLYDSVDNVDTVASIATEVTNVANISQAVVEVSTNEANITAVSENAANVNAVAANEANINAVNDNKTNIDTVAGSNTEIIAIAASLAAIIAVNDNKTNIDTVADNTTNINTVATDKTNIDAVAGSITKVDNVEANLAPIITVADNISAVQSAASNAAAAAASANQASASAAAAGNSATSALNSATAAGNSAEEAHYWAGQAAQGQVQSDWEQSNISAKDYIKNKPTTFDGYGFTDISVEAVDINRVINKKELYTFTGTVTTSWIGTTTPYSQVITLSGIQATDMPIMELVQSSDYDTAQEEQEEYSKIYRGVVSANTLTLYADEPTTRDITVQINALR